MFDFILLYLYARKIGVTAKLKERIACYDLGEYAEEAFYNAGVETVGQALMIRLTGEKIPGIGKKSWDTLMEAISK